MGKNKVLNFLSDFSSNPFDINSLLVSSYLRINGIVVNSNQLIKKYWISAHDVNYSKLNEFLILLKTEKKSLDLEELILLFEFVISPDDKIVNGAVYTPKYIRDFIVSSSIEKSENLKDAMACDIACGCGGFLFEYALKLQEKTSKSFVDIIEQNLFGIDITDYSIERTKILLTLLALSNGEDKEIVNFNLYIGDSLEFNWFERIPLINKNGGFDFIFSNPPYVGSSNLEEKTKQLMKDWSVSSTGKLDLYIPFFEIGLRWLRENGILGFITVNNFYRSLNGRALRKYFTSNQYEFKLIDFGSEQVFKSRLTYTCICQITKEIGSLSYTSSNPQKVHQLAQSDFINFDYNKLNDFDGWQLDDAKTQINIERLENSGKKLIELFDIKNGFATLRNNIYLFRPSHEDEDYYYFQKDNNEFQIEKDICKNAIKPNILKNESEIDILKEKLIFPYEIIDRTDNDLFETRFNRLVRIIPEKTFTENFPCANHYLSTYRNELAKRDKGKRDYGTWFAFGRSQALNVPGLKLMFPYMSNKPYFVYTEDEDILFYNGYALLSNSKDDLLFVQKILKSKVFWYYIKKTSKPYSGDYFSMAKNYVKNFSIPELTEFERKTFMKLKKKSSINKFLLRHYNITEIEI